MLHICLKASRRDAMRAPNSAELSSSTPSCKPAHMKRVALILLVLLSLPALLHIYQPPLRLGAALFTLGWIGQTVSPIILFWALAYIVIKEWR
jgi:hypothetical protein